MDTPTAAEVIRALIERANLSQRQAARELDVEERSVRHWCSGTRDVPRFAILALERLATYDKGIRDDLLVSRWHHQMMRNDRQIEFLESGTVALGYGPGEGSKRGAQMEAVILRQKNEAYVRMIRLRVRKLLGEAPPSGSEQEMDVLDRLEDAWQERQAAFFAMNKQFIPHGSGVVGLDSISDFDARDAEWKSIKAEMDLIVEEIRQGKRR